MAPTAWIEQVLKDTYRIDRLIGEGGTGLVYTGYHLRLRVAVAVKILRQNAGELAFARFRKEAEITARLRHPNIVQVLDYDVTPDGHAYLVIEWLEGETLAAFIKRSGAVPAETALDLLRPVCNAVAAAHVAGVVHRDLKPANLFITEGLAGTDGGPASLGPSVKVLDFGIAKLTELDPISTEQGQTLGTPRYMSPEQIRIDAAADVGPMSDQFSLGAITYELLAGRPAFPGSAHAAMLAVLDNRPPPLPTTVPAGFRQAVSRAMSSRPQDRYPTVTEFLHAMEEGLRFPVAPEPRRGEAPIGRGLIAFGMALSALLIVLILWANSARLRPPDPRPTSGPPPPPAAKQADPLLVTPLFEPPPPPLQADGAGAPKKTDRQVRVKILPARVAGAPLQVNGKQVRGHVIQGTPGEVLRIKAVAPSRSCCRSKEISYAVPVSAAPVPPVVIELSCDKDCPFY